MTEYTYPYDAACRGMSTELFYPLPGDAAGIARAKAVCATCSVVTQCLAEALAFLDLTDGIFGGTTGAERNVLLRRSA